MALDSTLRKSASHNPVIVGETTKPNIVTNARSPLSITFAGIVPSPSSADLSLDPASSPNAAHNTENGNPCTIALRRKIRNDTGIVRAMPKFLIAWGKTEYRTTNAALTGLRPAPRIIDRNGSVLPIFPCTYSERSVRPNMNARHEPQVLPAKLHANPRLYPKATPAAVSTTDVGRPHASHSAKPTAYKTSPTFPRDATSFIVRTTNARERFASNMPESVDASNSRRSTTMDTRRTVATRYDIVLATSTFAFLLPLPFVIIVVVVVVDVVSMGEISN